MRSGKCFYGVSACLTDDLLLIKGNVSLCTSKAFLDYHLMTSAGVSQGSPGEDIQRYLNMHG